MTNKQKILNYLVCRDWVVGAQMLRDITDRVSPATIDRLARQMAEDGEIDKMYSKDGFVMYKLTKVKERLF